MALLKWGSAAILAAALTVRGYAQAPGLTDAQARAGVLYNLAMFVEWPAGANDQSPASRPLTIGVTRADSVLAALRSVEGRPVNGRTLAIRDVRAGDDVSSCQILYIPELDREGQAWLESVARAPVLTVGDDERFLRAGGMIRLSFVDARVKFDIDVGHAERVGVRISSRVLALARVVRDGRDVGRQP